jgi:hypothetical protein
VWAWLFKQKDYSTGTAVDISVGGRFAQEVVGESHYQAALRKVAAGLGDAKDFTVYLIPDPRNKYDRNAVMVRHPQFGLLGHIPRHTATQVAPVLLGWRRENKFASCRARLAGGYGPHISFGVWIDVDFEQLQ